jgi:hypothetical protein
VWHQTRHDTVVSDLAVHRRTPESAPIKDSAGLPWGCCVMPLSPGEVLESRALEPILADQVPRCTECFGYINVYCMFEKKAWICSLCGCKNDLSQRYSSSTQRLSSACNLVLQLDCKQEIGFIVLLHSAGLAWRKCRGELLTSLKTVWK